MTNAALHSGAIRVPERGAVSISALLYRSLSESARIGDLVADGIISLFRSKEIPHGIRASSFVGHAVLENGQRLEITEKSDGALRTLLLWSLPNDIREIDAWSQIGPNSPVLQVFARRFLSSLSYYLRHGRRKVYQPQREVSSTVKGRISVRETVRVMSRGIRGSVVQYPLSLTADVTVNRLLHLGLLAVERILLSVPHAKDALAEARMYAPMFSDADIRQLRSLSYSSMSRLFAQAIEENRRSQELSNCLSFARALVLNLGAWPSDDDSNLIPNSYFLNLERLFEAAARQVLCELLPGFEVVRGGFMNRPLFPDLPSRYVADPDTAVASKGQAVCVLDTKYKNLGDYPAHDDVYQLFSHASAMGASSGVLLYPGQSFCYESIGKTASGLRIGFSTIRIANLPEDLRHLAEKCGLSHELAP